ncbi:DEAD/DEAH box helicase family protein [Pseudoalteromonas sp. APC 3355]|jgi:superfamily II DNA or RNA helicase|uniref:DEAD/DEAH box helicase n=1 Tax=Pseudoalteromonas sp. APC 3355 TaxID=3035199 RepID=UPI0025B3EFA9|nr:DEAD/DEAH box helicase family protein [Pseudoalteromonas sp. APC 3355]MDN3474456.1 DEAD/DEAH box helicase family protein [Pseudoalteromonas sp. APC 3355]
MKLRNWQSECIHFAISKYKSLKHFLALATPGAGKTVMASVLAKLMYDQGDIDLVLCFSPSSIVAHDFSEALGEQFDAHFDGTIGALGNSFTYQALGTLDNKVWRLFEKYRVFVIFDEIHHCAGSNIKDANAWGKPIITTIKEKAAYTIALTGTPWRSDALPIALAEYCNESEQIQCDYVYGLKQAITDNVCRIPQVVALDNDQITVVEGSETSHFTSFLELLSQSIIPYSEIVTNTSVIEQLLIHSSHKLNKLRCFNKEAGGLIVASSIAHAWQIQLIMKQAIGESALVVTSDEGNANGLIRSFRFSQDKWIISVGMISEGTNIPRLQVCCYLSNVKTEMNYRQVMGRLLRITNAPNQQAFLFMPAEPKLVEYAYRVAQDIPDELAKVKFAQMDEEIITEAHHALDDADIGIDDEISTDIEAAKAIISIGDTLMHTEESPTSFTDLLPSEIAISTDKIMGIFGKFNHKELEIDGFDQLIISEQSMTKLNKLSSEVF